MASQLASGPSCLGPAFMSTAALILSIFANSRCNLLKVDFDGVLDLFQYTPTSIGLWCYTAANDVLYDTTGYQVDSKYQAARALGTTTSCLGFCVWVFFLCAGCFRFSPMLFKIGGFCCFCCTTFQGLVFLLFKSEICSVWCGLDTGGNCAIAATVLWFVTCLMSCAAGKAPGDDEDGGEEEKQPKDDEEE